MNNSSYDFLDGPETAKPTTAFGVITLLSPLTIRVNGSTTAVHGFLNTTSYTPAVDDLVVLLRVGPDWIAIGAL